MYRWTARGTHDGEYDGIAPTGNQMMVSGITILHIANGQIVDNRFESNLHTLPDSISEAVLTRFWGAAGLRRFVGLVEAFCNRLLSCRGRRQTSSFNCL